MSQEHQTPVFALDRHQLDAVGVVLEGFEILVTLSTQSSDSSASALSS